MQRALDASAIVVAEGADTLDDVVDVLLAHGVGRQQHFVPGQPSLRLATQVHHHLEQLTTFLKRLERITDVRR